ncbi:MAG: motility associated factor glycosyltransferase family protein [Succinivibrio sp.]|nr:motility associated factor glycosyltransferase family protein [Succinivibrio sp.]
MSETSQKTNQDIFSENLGALRQNNSLFVEKLDKYQSSHEYAIELEQGLEATLIVDGRQLTSRHNREVQAQHLCRSINFNENVVIYGFGLGDEVRFVLSKLSAGKHVYIILLNPQLFVSLLSIDETLSGIFQDPRVIFTIPDNRDPIRKNCVVVFSELYLAPEEFNDLKSRLISMLDDAYGRIIFNRDAASKINNCMLNNKDILKNAVLYSDSVIKKTPNILVLGSGPSLQLQTDSLKKLIAQGYKTIAADTALTELENINIVPDYVVTNDIGVGIYVGKGFFKNFQNYKNSTLFYSGASPRNIIEPFPGPKYCLVSDRLLSQMPELFKDKIYRLLNGIGSVLLSAVMLAIDMQPKNIALLGADFAFIGSKTHAGVEKSSYAPSAVRIKVECMDGSMQDTIRNFLLYKQYLEELIRRHQKDIKFTNYSKTGAVIYGCEVPR